MNDLRASAGVSVAYFNEESNVCFDIDFLFIKKIFYSGLSGKK